MARTRLILSLLVLPLVVVVGTLGYIVLEPSVSIVDALYMTAITLSTVGYSEPPWIDTAGRIWSITILALGVVAVALSLASLQAIVVSGELRRVMGRRRLKHRIEHLDRHVILCGWGRMGQFVARDLARQRIPVVVIEVDPDRTALLEESGDLYVLGDAQEEDCLLEAGLLRARALVATLPSDAANVFVTLTARSLHSDLQIIARAEQVTTENKLKRAGADRVVCPQVIGGHRIANIITRPNVVDFPEAVSTGLEFEMDEHLVTNESPMLSRTLGEAALRQRAGVMVVAIKRKDGKTVYNPSPDERVEKADRLVMIGPAGASRRLAELDLD